MNRKVDGGTAATAPEIVGAIARDLGNYAQQHSIGDAAVQAYMNYVDQHHGRTMVDVLAGNDISSPERPIIRATSIYVGQIDDSLSVRSAGEQSIESDLSYYSAIDDNQTEVGDLNTYLNSLDTEVKSVPRKYAINLSGGPFQNVDAREYFSYLTLDANNHESDKLHVDGIGSVKKSELSKKLGLESDEIDKLYENVRRAAGNREVARHILVTKAVTLFLSNGWDLPEQLDKKIIRMGNR